MKKKYVISVLVFLVLMISIITYIYWPKEKPLIGLYGVYDKDGNEIKPSGFVEQTYLVANSQEYFGAASIKLFVQPKNDDTVTLEFDMTTLSTTADIGSATAFSDAMALTTKTAVAGELATKWITDNIPIAQFADSDTLRTVTFGVVVTAVSPADATAADTRLLSTSDLETWSMQVKEDPSAQFSVVVGAVGLGEQFLCPVGIDNGDGTCTVILQAAGTENLGDAYVKYDNPDINYGGSTRLYTGWGSSPSWHNQANTFLLFDLSSLPSDVFITDSTLYLFYDGQDGGIGSLIEFTVRRVINVWNENDITWNNKPLVDNFVYDVVLGSELQGIENWDKWVSWDITILVNEWYDSIYLNRGVFLNNSELSYGVAKFCSKEHSDLSLRPYLSITYELGSPGPVTP